MSRPLLRSFSSTFHLMNKSKRHIPKDADPDLVAAFKSLKTAIHDNKPIHSNRMAKANQIIVHRHGETEIQHHETISPSLFYQSLNASVEKKKLMNAEIHYKLHPKFLQDLRQRLAKVKPITATTSRKERLTTLETLAELIQVNALDKNLAMVKESFDQIQEWGLEPDVHCLNGRLHAAFELESLDEGLKWFDQFHNVYKVLPNSKSYEILIRALNQHQMYIKANQAFRTMQSNGVVPTQSTYRVFIEAAIESKRYRRAWQIFDHMRVEIHDPNTETYATMIDLCGREEEAERALDLFQEMSDRGIEWSHCVFAGMIRALGSRIEFYHDAFGLLEQMEALNYSLEPAIYHSLFKACAKQGDYARGRLIWNQMIQKSVNDIQYAPDTNCYEQLIILLRNARKILKEGECLPKFEIDGPLQRVLNKHHVPLNNEDCIYLVLPEWNEPQPFDFDSLVKQVWDNVTQCSLENPETALPLIPIHTSLLDQFLDYYAQMDDPTHFEIAKVIFDKAYDMYQCPRLGHAYSSMLKISSHPKLIEKHDYWSILMEWDAQREAILEKGHTPIHGIHEQRLNLDTDFPSNESDFPISRVKYSEFEKEEERQRDQRGKKEMFQNFLIMINGYSRVDHIDKALETVKQAKTFRHEYYLPAISYDLIPELVEKVLNLGEHEGKYEPAKQLRELCPEADPNPIDHVRKMIDAGQLLKDWWGFDVLGISKAERQALFKNVRVRNKT